MRRRGIRLSTRAGAGHVAPAPGVATDFDGRTGGLTPSMGHVRQDPPPHPVLRSLDRIPTLAYLRRKSRDRRGSFVAKSTVADFRPKLRFVCTTSNTISPCVGRVLSL